jgi:tyrosyl-tRNA synthetase
MSKSLGNYIGVTEASNDMFGKILSISDELMWRYYELLSTRSLDDIATLKADVEAGKAHPKKVKVALAKEIVTRFHDASRADVAESEFDQVHKQHALPSDIQEVSMEGPVWIAKALVDAGLEKSTTNARKMIQQGAVKIDQVKCDDKDYHLELGTYILQVGKRKFAKVTVSA